MDNSLTKISMRRITYTIVTMLILLLIVGRASAQPVFEDQRDENYVQKPYTDFDQMVPGCVNFYEGGYEDIAGRVVFLKDGGTLAIVAKEAIMDAGEIIIYQDFDKDKDKDLASHFIDTSNGVRYVDEAIDSLDNQTIVFRAPVHSSYGVLKMGLFPTYDGPTSEWRSGRYMSFTTQWIGLLTDFRLSCIDAPEKSLDEWVKEKAMTEKTSTAEITWRLTNELECRAVDTYGQKITLNCTYYSWELDKENGTATFTPYFTPRLYKTKWKSGEPFEMTFSANKAAGVEEEGESYTYRDNKLTLRLWGTAGNPTAIGKGSAEPVVRGVYDLAGRCVAKSTAGLPAGLYVVVKEDGRCEKIVVK